LTILVLLYIGYLFEYIYQHLRSFCHNAQDGKIVLLSTFIIIYFIITNNFFAFSFILVIYLLLYIFFFCRLFHNFKVLPTSSLLNSTNEQMSVQ